MGTTPVYNFGAGPAMLPRAVMEQARAEFLDWHGTGMSVVEMSHRSRHFIAIAEQSEADLRALLAIPDNYRVLFLQGGATAQFAMVPLNLLAEGDAADYVHTGYWSGKAIKEARRLASVHIAASSETDNFMTLPEAGDWQVSDAAKYVYYTSNETIGGVEFHWVPDTGDVPLVADMSSTLLSRPIDVSKFGVIYAGAQKNIGPAGLTVVIVREDLLGKAQANTPAMFDYKIHADADSMYNTPPTYAWYLAGLVFQYLKRKGGLQAMAEINKRKADKLYAAIDDSGFYRNPVEKSSRSWMNVPFTLADANLDKTFLAEAAQAGLKTLGGHRSVGGMRASIYNAMPEAGVDALVAFMQDFAQRNG